MPNPGDFDPAEAVQGVRQQRAAEEAEKQRVQAQKDLHRANILKLLLYADEQLEDIRNPIVSEFVITEKWWVPEPKHPWWKKLRADQELVEVNTSPHLGNLTHGNYRVIAVTRHERQTRYYGSWLSLNTTLQEAYRGYDYASRSTQGRGLVKLRQPRVGYAHVSITSDWDPSNVGYITIDLTDRHGREILNTLDRPFRIVTSLEEATEGIRLYPRTSQRALNKGASLRE